MNKKHKKTIFNFEPLPVSKLVTTRTQSLKVTTQEYHQAREHTLNTVDKKVVFIFYFPSLALDQTTIYYFEVIAIKQSYSCHFEKESSLFSLCIKKQTVTQKFKNGTASSKRKVPQEICKQIRAPGCRSCGY